MPNGEGTNYSDIGAWSEAKLEPIRKYGKAYSTILSKRPNLTHAYIDAFAGAGMQVSRTTGDSSRDPRSRRSRSRHRSPSTTS